VQGEYAKLIEAVPQWKDKAVWQRDSDAIRDYAVKQGIPADELERVANASHLNLVMLRKAMLYDRMMSAKPTPKVQPQASTSSPPVLKPGSAASVPSRQSSDMTKAKQRLAKTGSVRDAAALIEKLL
jgi:hypothetical protein